MAHNNAPTSAKILSILESGHHVEMWYYDDKYTREEINPVKSIKITIRPLNDGNDGTAQEVRTRDGEIVAERRVGQPKIDRLVKNRSWTINKQD